MRPSANLLRAIATWPLVTERSTHGLLDPAASHVRTRSLYSSLYTDGVATICLADRPPPSTRAVEARSRDVAIWLSSKGIGPDCVPARSPTPPSTPRACTLNCIHRRIGCCHRRSPRIAPEGARHRNTVRTRNPWRIRRRDPMVLRLRHSLPLVAPLDRRNEGLACNSGRIRHSRRHSRHRRIVHQGRDRQWCPRRRLRADS